MAKNFIQKNPLEATLLFLATLFLLVPHTTQMKMPLIGNFSHMTHIGIGLVLAGYAIYSLGGK